MEQRGRNEIAVFSIVDWRLAIGDWRSTMYARLWGGTLVLPSTAEAGLESKTRPTYEAPRADETMSACGGNA